MPKRTQRGLDQAVEDSMKLFDRARVRSVAPIEPRRPRTVLLVVDGSSQDRLGRAITERLRRRFDGEAVVADARESTAEDDLASQVARSLGGRPAAKTAGESFEQILAAIQSARCDLVVTPCPYGRDLESVGPDSAGTVIDVLLARSPVPILIVRRPYEPEDELFHQVRMVLTAENEAAIEAAAWAAGLIADRGEFQLVLVLEREMCENIHALMESLAPNLDVSADSLSHALVKTHMRLHRSLQQTAARRGFSYRLQLRVGGEAAGDAVESDDARTLVVLALERRDPASLGGVQKRIRLSPNPVLVACKD